MSVANSKIGKGNEPFFRIASLRSPIVSHSWTSLRSYRQLSLTHVFLSDGDLNKSRFCNENPFEFQMPRDWKNRTFLPRDLKLSNFGKRKLSLFIIVHYNSAKIFKFAMLDIYKAIAERWHYFVSILSFWLNKLNEFEGSFLFKSPFLPAIPLYPAQHNRNVYIFLIVNIQQNVVRTELSCERGMERGNGEKRAYRNGQEFWFQMVEI